MEATEASRERFARKNEDQLLRAAFERLDSNHDGQITMDELQAYFEAMGHKAKKAEVEDMIWEVDEDCDGSVNYKEFLATWQRCRKDKAGTEPWGLYNVVLFLLHDRSGSGRVSLEEAMKITYLRVGKESLDAQLAAVFGTADLTSSKSLSLTEFLQCLHEYHLQRIRARPTLRSMKKGGSGGEAAAAQAPAVAAK
jgi:calmodulin